MAQAVSEQTSAKYRVETGEVLIWDLELRISLA